MRNHRIAFLMMFELAIVDGPSVRSPCHHIEKGSNGINMDYILGSDGEERLCCLLNRGTYLVEICNSTDPASTIFLPCPDGTFMDEFAHANYECKIDIRSCNSDQVFIFGEKIARSRCECKFESPLHPGECISIVSNEVENTSIPQTGTSASSMEYTTTYITPLITGVYQPSNADHVTVFVVFGIAIFAGIIMCCLCGKEKRKRPKKDMKRVIQYFRDKSKDANFALNHGDVSEFLMRNGNRMQLSLSTESISPAARLAKEIENNYRDLDWTVDTVIDFFERKGLRRVVEELQNLLCREYDQEILDD